MKTFNRRELLLVAGAAGTLAACRTTPMAHMQIGSLQDTSRSRPFQFIVPAPAGGRNDLAGRAIAGALAKELGEPVDVINPEDASPGAHAALAAAPHDGRTLGLVTVDIAMMHWRGLAQVSHRDYTPLALMSEDAAAVHVRADGPFVNAKKLLAHVRANPGQLKASGVGRGGIWHLSTLRWLTAAGLAAEAMQWVDAAGPAPALRELAIGAVDVVVCSIPEVRATPDAKTTRTLAVMARERNVRYPEVPTLQEATGLRYALSAWRGVAAPRGLPRETASRLAGVLKKAWDSQAFRNDMRRRGFSPVWRGPMEFSGFIEAEDGRLGRTIQMAGMAKA